MSTPWSSNSPDADGSCFRAHSSRVARAGAQLQARIAWRSFLRSGWRFPRTILTGTNIDDVQEKADELLGRRRPEGL
jgi:hypothetical protein